MRFSLAAGVALSLRLFAQEIQTVEVASGISAPTDIQNAGGSGRLFLVEQGGIVPILRNGALVSTPFLDIRNKTHGGGERGLLGLVFPPEVRERSHALSKCSSCSGSADEPCGSHS